MRLIGVKHYGILQLVRILIYRVVYKIKLKTVKCFVPTTWSTKNTNRETLKDFSNFFTHCGVHKSEIIREADSILNGDIVIFGNLCKIDPFRGWLIDPITGGLWRPNVYFSNANTQQKGLADVKYVLELNKFNHLVRVALAFYHTRDSKYTRFIANSIKGYRETVKPYRSIVQRIIMDMGFRIINLIQILLLCKDDKEFQQRTAPLINGIIFDQVKAMEMFHTAKWFKTGNGANHVIGEMVGLILGQLWLQANGIAQYDKKYRKEYAYLVEVLNRTVAPSGAYLEQSGNYSRLVAEFLVIFDLIKNCLGHKGYYPEYEEGQYKNRLLQYLRDISYHDYLPNFGDNDNARVLTAFRGYNEEVEYFLDNLNPTYTAEVYLDGSQWVYRSQDEKDLYIFSRVGKFAYFREGASIHAHNDLLAILMGVHGVPLFVDKGMLFYNSGSDLRKTYSQMSVHNTVCLDGIEINSLGVGICFKYPQCEYVKDDIQNNVIFSGDLKYDDVEHKRIISHHNRTVEIEDTILLKGKGSVGGYIHYLLHPNVKAEKEGGDVVLTMSDGQKITMSIKGIKELEIVKTDYSPKYGQVAKTTLIEGLFTAERENSIKTYISF